MTFSIENCSACGTPRCTLCDVQKRTRIANSLANKSPTPSPTSWIICIHNNTTFKIKQTAQTSTVLEVAEVLSPACHRGCESILDVDSEEITPPEESQLVGGGVMLAKYVPRFQSWKSTWFGALLFIKGVDGIPLNKAENPTSLMTAANTITGMLPSFLGTMLLCIAQVSIRKRNEKALSTWFIHLLAGLVIGVLCLVLEDENLNAL